ncbi:hypothetical protein [Leptolyngbya sp. AN10]|uniref:hypothetical protein n=1 Tax=Leptolyngbya sp. AN10 TaxID=3423365 RepID=UPI003D315F29
MTLSNHLRGVFRGILLSISIAVVIFFIFGLIIGSTSQSLLTAYAKASSWWYGAAYTTAMVVTIGSFSIGATQLL